jgi:hypothetical protein
VVRGVPEILETVKSKPKTFKSKPKTRFFKPKTFQEKTQNLSFYKKI